MFDAEVDIASVDGRGGIIFIHPQLESRLESRVDVGDPMGTGIDEKIMNRAITTSE